MKQLLTVLTVLVVGVVMAVSSFAAEGSDGDSGVELDLVVNARPASLLVDVDGKKFGVNGNTMS